MRIMTDSLIEVRALRKEYRSGIGKPPITALERCEPMILNLHPAVRVQKIEFGAEKAVLLVIDNFVAAYWSSQYRAAIPLCFSRRPSAHTGTSWSATTSGRSAVITSIIRSR